MKKLSLIIAISTMALTTNSWAQENNKWMITTNTMISSLIGQTNAPMGISYTRISEDDEDFSMVTVGGAAGYQIINQLYGGLSLGYGRENYEDDAYASVLLAGPFVRYYLPIGKPSLLLEANASFGNSTDNFFDEEETTSLSTFGGVVGLAFPLTNFFNLEAQLAFSNLKAEDEDAVDVLGLRIGMTVLF